MAINDFRDFIYPVWYKDSKGNKISYTRTNETYVIVKNKFLLKEIPDEYAKVFIKGYYEVIQGSDLSDNQYSVNYYTGEVTFNPSQNAKTVTVTNYAAKGIVYIFAERVISTFDSQNNTIKETLADVVNNLSAKGTYSVSTTYYPRNVVSYAGSSYLCKQQCTGVTPTNTDYWQLISQYGQGLVYRGEYDSLVTYEANQFISYNNLFYFCKQQTIGNLPTTEDYWCILPFPTSTPTRLYNTVTVGDSPVSSIDIGISSFNATNDDLMVHCNSTYLEKDSDYTISGTTISKVSGTWNTGSVFNFRVEKNVIQNLVYSDGSMIQDASVNKSKLTTDVQSLLNKFSLLSDDIASVKMFGDTWTGDVSTAVQAAVSASSVIFFPPGNYSFKNIVIDHPIRIIGLGCTFNPIHKTVSANASESMFIATDVSYVRIENISVVGSYITGSYVDGVIVDNYQSGTSTNTSSIFKFTRVGEVTFNGVSFSDLDNTYRLTAQTLWADRNAIAMTFVDCPDIYLYRVKVSNLHGDEWIWRIFSGVSGGLTYSQGITRVIECTFENNKEPGSSLGLIGGYVYVEHNEFLNYYGEGSLANLVGAYTYIRYNNCYGLNVNSVFDTCEGSFFKNEYVECIGNYMDEACKLTYTGIKTNTRTCKIEDNTWVCRTPVLHLIYPSTTATPIENYVNESTRYVYDEIRINNNIMSDLYDGSAEPTADQPMIMIGRHNSYSTTGGIRMKVCEIRGNTIKSIQPDIYQPVHIYVLANSFDFCNNKINALGKVSGTTVAAGYIRIYLTDNTEAVVRVENNLFTNENYDLSSFTKIAVLITTGGTNTYKVYFSDNVTSVLKSSNPILEESYNAGTLMAVDNDVGFIKSATLTDIASAATITIPSSSDFYNITGTTAITGITASWVGRKITLKFADILTFTDGSNLKLNGNFTTSADDTITLVCDGTNWYEVCRSAN